MLSKCVFYYLFFSSSKRTINIINKFIVLFFCVSIFLLNSCKSDLEKIDTNKVDLHIAYQDSIMDKDTIPELKFGNIKNLIGEYRSMNIKNSESNENYCLYLARLYSTLSNEFEVENFWVDAKANKLRDTEYANCHDSTLYFSEKALSINENNTRAMYILCFTYMFETINSFKLDKYNLPHLTNRDPNKFQSIGNYIVNNALRFKDLDTTEDKRRSLAILECGIILLQSSLEKGDYAFDPNDINKLNAFYLFGELFDQLKGKKKSTFSFDKKSALKNLYPKVLKTREESKEYK